MPWTKALVFLLLTTAVTPGVIGEESSTENLRRLLTNRFSTNRHHSANPEFKEATRVFLTDTFQSYGLHVTLQNFTSDRTGYQGENIIGTLSGRFTGTPADMPVLLAAHYDTMPDTPGVDDNGSGLAALLESARLITSQPCKLAHSVIFVAFDFEEYGKEGSTVYVRNILVPYLTQNGIPLADFQGAVSMDTLMNYNNSEGLQYVPSEFGMVPDPDNMYNNVAADGFRGNFLGVVGRRAHDARLYSPFLQTWSGTAQYRTVSMLLPMKDVYQDGPSDPFWPVYRELLRSDHASFWREHPDLKAVQLTDTGQFRGHMQQCYHRECDDLRVVTEDGLLFLKKTTDAVTSTLLRLAGGGENCTDGPKSSAPPSGRSALQAATITVAACLVTASLAVMLD